MIKIENYANPFDALSDFEMELSSYTNAPFVVVTDSCTHALELCLRYEHVAHLIGIPACTYLSVPMLFYKLDIPYTLLDDEWQGEYQIRGTKIWDSARMLAPEMYRPGQFQCLSFGRTKPLEIGRGGAILTDSVDAYEYFKLAANDGRDLRVKPWQAQNVFPVGYHYRMLPEEAVKGLNLMAAHDFNEDQTVQYPDLREITIHRTRHDK
jgi:dTDP-4-amino-4,6-dideoxygalactose transaminase